MPVKDAHTKWTDYETAVLTSLIAAGKSRQEIAAKTGRSIGSVQERLRWLNMTEDQRQKRREQIKARRDAAKKYTPKRGRTPSSNGITLVTPISVPEYVIAERELRHISLFNRSLTALICGDPAPGWSALDRRQS